MVDQPKALREGLTTEHRVAILNKEAKSYISVGNYEAAITCCSTAISLNESNLAYLSRAHCYKNLKRWKEAISDYSAAIANDPSSSSTLCQRGLSYAKLEMYSEAIEDLSGAYIMDPTPSNCFNRGVVYHDAGFYENALQDFTRIIELKENDSVVYKSFYQRANIYVKMGKLSEAIIDLTEILRHDPNNLASRVLLGKAYKQQNNFVAAEEALGHAISLDPSQYDIFMERGDVRCRMGRKFVPNAIADFSHAISLLSENEQRKSAISMETAKVRRSHSMGRHTAKSIKNPVKMKKIKRHVSTTSAEAEIVGMLHVKQANAKLLMKTESDAQDALLDAEYALTLNPDNDYCRYTVATCLARNNRNEEAIAALETILDSNPQNNKALYLQAYCYRAQTMPMNAVENLTKIIANDVNGKRPSSATASDSNGEKNFLVQVFEMRAMLLYELKAYKFALADFAQAIVVQSTKPELFFFRGCCLCKVGRYEQAMSDYIAAEELGFPEMISLWMEKANVMMLMSMHSEALLVLEKALDHVHVNLAATASRDTESLHHSESLPSQLHYYRINMLRVMCLIEIKDYQTCIHVLVEMSKFYDLDISIDVDAKVVLNAHADSKKIEWNLRYHSGLCYYMTRDYLHSAMTIRQCFEVLKNFAPDETTIGGTKFFFSIALYLAHSESDLDTSSDMKLCVRMLTECLQSPWVQLSDHNLFLCYFARGKTCQRLKLQSEAIADFTTAISFSNEDIAYGFFRRAWSYKALFQYDLAASDFEMAKKLKPNDTNFFVTYRDISSIEFIEIETEPDRVEPFRPYVPLS